MRRVSLTLAIVVLALTTGCRYRHLIERKDGPAMAQSGTKGEAMLAHNVFFTLKDDSTAARKRLIDSCHRYLKGHPGIVFFAAGARAEELDRPVNDREFDVGLHIVFQNKAFHDEYQTWDSHVQFIEQHRDNWEKVRVFDTLTG